MEDAPDRTINPNAPLCVGGPLDGWNVQVDRGAPSFRAPVPAPYPGANVEPEYATYRQHRFGAHSERKIELFDVYAPEGASPADVFTALLLGYSAMQRQRREGTG